MITLTFKDFFETEWGEGAHEMYILKRGNDIVYIGISERGIWNRWFSQRGHMPRNGWGEFFHTSQAGRAVIENFPKSWGWTVELWTLKDCVEFLTEHADKRFTKIHQVEILMIEKLQPALNVSHAYYSKDTSDLIDQSHLQKAHRDLYG